MKTKILSFVKHTYPRFRSGCGWGNGYVVVFKGHPSYGKSYHDLDVNVHGGLTFSHPANEIDWPEITQEMKDGWIFGFDTCHYMDTLENWSKEDVIAETEYLKNEFMSFSPFSIKRNYVSNFKF